jgi:hypothetical protein
MFWTYPYKMPVVFALCSVTHWFDVMIVQTVAWFFCSFTLACHFTPCHLVILDLCTDYTLQIKKSTPP